MVSEQMAMPGVAEEDRPAVVLIDGFALIFRAYFGMPTTMNTSAGEPIGAVLGFTRMLLDVLNSTRPEYLLLTLDAGPTFRHEEYADYKAQRPPMPEDLRVQLGRVREVVEALNIPIYELPGYEADDLIGTLAGQAATQGLKAVILTGDRDLLQVIRPHIEVVTPSARGFNEAPRRFDEAEVYRRFGFPPKLLPDYKALLGDTSDNIPGVPGIGEKTAKVLVSQFGTLETMLAHIDEVTPPRARESLRTNAEQAKQSKRLATIVTDLPVTLDLERCRARDFDRTKVKALFRDLEFRSLMNHVPEPLTAAPEPVGPAAAANWHAVRTRPELEALMQRLRPGPVALDTEGDGLDALTARLVGISLAGGPDVGYYLPIGHQDGTPQLDLATVQAVLGPLLADASVPKVAHHAKFDLHMLERHELPVHGLTMDTMIAAYLLGTSSVGLKDLAFVELGREMTHIDALIGRGKAQVTMAEVPSDQAAAYAADDAACTFALVERLQPRLEERDLMRLLNEVELPLVPILAEMERWGIAVDVDYLRELSKRLDVDIDQLERHIHAMAGHAFNINSTQQLGTVLFEELGLKGGRKTAKGGFSTASEVLESLVDRHEIVGQVLNHRQLVKLKGTYVDSLQTAVNPHTGRVHTSYSQTTAATGRLASLDPNLQNIPIRTEIGREVRRAFIADRRPDWAIHGARPRLVSVDYSQIELRILAHISGDETLTAAFMAGQDVHRSTASELFGVPLADVTSDMRRIAKTVNFGVMYGQGAFGLARETGLAQREASQFIDAYRKRFQRVFESMERAKQQAAEQGYVTTVLGRRRYLPDITSGNPNVRANAERMAINTPIQGTAADMMKLAMIGMAGALHAENFATRMLLQVHDELVFEAPPDEIDRLVTTARRVMSQALPLNVPVEVEAKVGDNWDEMTPVA